MSGEYKKKKIYIENKKTQNTHYWFSNLYLDPLLLILINMRNGGDTDFFQLPETTKHFPTTLPFTGLYHFGEKNLGLTKNIVYYIMHQKLIGLFCKWIIHVQYHNFIDRLRLWWLRTGLISYFTVIKVLATPPFMKMYL